MAKKVFNMQGGLHSAAAFTAFENRLYGESVKASADSFAVSSGVGMNVAVAPGDGLLRIDAYLARRIQITATEAVAVTPANASFARIDTVVAYIDTAVAPTTAVIDNINDVLKLMCVPGTAAASPAAPTGAAIQAAIGAGNPYMVLTDVTVPQGATNLAAATFTNRTTVAGQSHWADLSKYATLTFSSYDATTKTGIVSTTADLRNVIQFGDRIAITQATGGLKFALVHAVSATNVTLFFGTDYALVNQTISSPVFSKMDSPQGFPKDPVKWTLVTRKTTRTTIGAPALNTWYNAGGSLLIGPGNWIVSALDTGLITSAGTGYLGFVTVLGTASNGSLIPDSRQRSAASQPVSSEVDDQYFIAGVPLNVAANTTIYLLRGTAAGSGVTLYSEATNSAVWSQGENYIKALSAAL